MAKSRRKKLSSIRTTPMKSKVEGICKRHPVVAGKGLKEIEDMREEDVIESIAADLTSASAVKKECGCALLGALADNKHKDILDRKLVRIVAPLVIEQPPALGFAALGAMKQLSLASDDVSDEMVAQDVMTPLCALINSYFDGETVHAKDMSEKIFIEAVELLSNLCEASQVALSVFNRSNLIHVLLRHANPRLCGHDVAVAALQCLYSVSENNPRVSKDIENAKELFSELVKDDGSEAPPDLLTKILTCGVLLNAATTPTSEFRMLSRVFEIVSKVLNQDQRKMVNDYTSFSPILNQRKEKVIKVQTSEEVMEDNNGEQKQAEAALKASIRHVLVAQQTAVEILTNLCYDEEQDEWKADDIDSDVSDDNLSVEGSGIKVSAEVLEGISSHGLVAVVLAKANLPAENVCDLLRDQEDGQTVLQMLSALRSRSFLCLNNLIGAMSIDDLGGADDLFSVWSNLGLLCFKSPKKVSGDASLFDPATSAMRAITRKLVDAKCHSQFLGLASSDYEQMFQFATSSTSAIVRINMVEIIGGIGCLSTLGPEDNLARDTSQFLLTAAAKDADLRVVAEALDKIFDMFAEDSTDQLCSELELVAQLKHLLPCLKEKIATLKKEGGKSTRDCDAVLNVAKVNLQRFIKYKERRPVL